MRNTTLGAAIKIIFVLMLAMPLFSFGFAAHMQTSTPMFLRVGLESHFREQSQITIPSTYLAVGQLVGEHFQISGFLTSHDGFTARPDNSYYIRLSYSFASLTQAQNTAGLYNGAVPALLGDGNWGIYMPGLDGIHGDVVFPSAYRVSLWAQGQVVLISDNVQANLQVQDSGGITSLGTRQYRGVIEFARFGGNLLTAVNVIDIEEYLLSVVPAEMPASWHIEALKAQAVAARTYTVNRLGSLAHRGYDLCDTTFSQVYMGVSSEHANTTEAVNATRGIMIFHDNQPIEAVYFSSSGGFTDNSENVWVATVPYLRAVAEVNEPGAMTWNRTITLTQLNGLLASNNVNIGNATGIQLDKSATGRVQTLTILGTTGNHALTREAIRWFFSPSLESRNFTITGVGTTPVQGVETPTPTGQTTGSSIAHVRSAAGTQTANLQGLQAMGQFGTATLTQNTVAVQSASGVVNLQTTQGQPNLPNQPEIGNQIASTAVSTGYQISLSGRGWGHGVGMSQHGAHGMAQQGFNFRQILQHYYTGVEIR